MRAMIACAASLFAATTFLTADPPKSALPAPEVKLQTAVDVVPEFPLARMEMVKIPAGTVEVPGKDGGETKKVEVKSIWIGRTELTWDAYDPYWTLKALDTRQKAAAADGKAAPSRPYGVPDLGFGHEGFPVICMTDNSARMYCLWLTEKTGRTYRLPTQAEWIHAAQAGKPARKLDKDALKKVAWFADNSEVADVAQKQTHAVATLAPNAWGLYDMLGNAAEWVTIDDGSRIVMGGHYDERAGRCQTTSVLPYNIDWQLRDPSDPKSKWWLSDGPFVSFRVVRED